jgi:hypothetical protein
MGRGEDAAEVRRELFHALLVGCPLPAAVVPRGTFTRLTDQALRRISAPAHLQRWFDDAVRSGVIGGKKSEGSGGAALHRLGVRLATGCIDAIIGHFATAATTVASTIAAVSPVAPTTSPSGKCRRVDPLPPSTSPPAT